MKKYTQEGVCLELTLPADQTVGFTINLEANQAIKLRVNPRVSLYIKPTIYLDINRVPIKVGHVVKDFCTQNNHPDIYIIRDQEHLERCYINSRGLLEVMNDD